MSSDLRRAVEALRARLAAEAEREQANIYVLAGPSGARSGGPVALAIARNDVRHEVLAAIDAILDEFSE